MKRKFTLRQEHLQIKWRQEVRAQKLHTRKDKSISNLPFSVLFFLLWRLFLLFWIEDNNDTEKRIVVVIIIYWYMTFDFDCWKWIDVCLWDRVRLGLIHNKNSASCVHFLQLWGCKILFYFSYENSCHSYKIILPLHNGLSM